jgi:hypothetical protein
MENEKDGGIHISGVTGEVSGVIQGGTGNIAGKYVVVGTGTINASEQQLTKIPDDYANALRKFSENINKQLEGSQIPQEQIESIKQSIRVQEIVMVFLNRLYIVIAAVFVTFWIVFNVFDQLYFFTHSNILAT